VPNLQPHARRDVGDKLVGGRNVGTGNFTRGSVWRVNIVSARSFGMVEAASALEVRAFWIGSLRSLVALSCSMRLAL
jgi:hypothetical protein